MDLDGQDTKQRRAGAGIPGGPVLLRTKLRPPPVRAGLIPRARLEALLEAGTQTRLCLLDAPAGSGKTTLLAQWFQGGQASRGVAWVSLDESDDDPVRFWVYLLEAFRVVQPGFGDAPLGVLQSSGSANVLTQVVLPQLLNELATTKAELVLVLDDHHLIGNPTCHRTLGFFIDHLPANIHLVVSTRVDPPLPLARLRASGELTELRIAELGFDAEAAGLLLEAMGLDLTPQQVQRLWERTEGWAAGLVLAGLSLQGRADPEPLIGSLQAGHRHIVDYLGSEVLARQSEPLRSFMVRTSILRRLSASLCDAVLESNDSAELLAELEQANLFLIALDDHREWYRYHHLFAQLLRLELAQREPELAPELHRRAAAWFEDAGDVDAAIHHAARGGEFVRAGALIAQHSFAYGRRGQRTTVQRWFDELPDDFILANPPIALLAAWVLGVGNGSLQAMERWLAAAEAGDYRGPLPVGIGSVPFWVALIRAVNIFDNVGRALQASRQALDAAGPSVSGSYWMAATALGRNLYLSGRLTEARSVLEEVAANPPPLDQHPFAVVNAFAFLSLLTSADGDDERALGLARQAMDAAEAQGIRHDAMTGPAYIALARSTWRQGGLAEAEQLLEQALGVSRSDSFKLQYVHALLELAAVRHARGNADGAQVAVARAQQLIMTVTDPGMLGALLDRTEREVSRPRRRRPLMAVSLTDRELVVLRMLPTALSQREIAQELTVSVNTVRTHVHAIYRKLGVASRREATAVAREQGLLPDPGLTAARRLGSTRSG